MIDGFHVVIPARLQSTRLPRKPLAEIQGKPMVLHVAEAALKAEAKSVIVATDSTEVADVVMGAGFEAQLTNPDHQSGSDRVMEVVQKKGWPDNAIVINVQGDEPLLPPPLVRQLATAMQENPLMAVATLGEPLSSMEQLLNPNVVKLVRRMDGRALYFSRAPIPWYRDGFRALDIPQDAHDRVLPGNTWRRHIGLYGFRVAALRQFCAAPASELEQLEALEQLRMLEMGLDIHVLDAMVAVPAGVDTAADLDRVRRWFATKNPK